MRNYYQALGIQRSAAPSDVIKAVGALSPEQLDDEGDLQSVLENDQWRTHYQRTHLQYEAIAAAMNNPAMDGSDNSHSWDKRVVEFEPIQNTIEL